MGIGQLSETAMKGPLSMTPSVIKAAALCFKDCGGCIEQPERPDFSNGSLRTLSRELLEAFSSASFRHPRMVFLTTDSTDAFAKSSEVRILLEEN